MNQDEPRAGAVTPDESTQPYTPPPEPVPTSVATGPVETAPRPRPGATRWGIALGIVAIAIGVAAAAAFVLTGQAAPSTLLGYTPPGTVVYTELRLDLPGDQRLKVGEFLSKFPGFDDTSTLEAKISDVLDRLLGQAGDGSHDYSGDIKPWFAGELGMAVGALPDPAAAEDTTRLLVLATVSDPAAARAWVTELAKDHESTTETYAGTQLTVYDGAVRMASAVGGDKVLLVGDVTSVKASLDAAGRSSFASNDGMRAARAGIKGDHLGFMFLDFKAYVDWIERSAESFGGVGMGMGSFDESMRAYLPDWIAGGLRAEGDALALDSVMPHLSTNPIKENKTGQVADHLPPTTFLLGDAHEFGLTLDSVMDVYRKDPATADAFKQVDDALGTLGGFEAVFGWMGETGMAVSRTADGIEGGVVVVPNDQAAAERLLTSLRSFAQLGGAQMGIVVREETYAGQTITIVDFGDIGERLGSGAAPGLPTGLQGRIEVAYTATDGAVIVGSGPGFVRSAIDAGPGKSLAEDARYRGLVDRVGAQNAGVSFLDMTAMRELLEQLAIDNGMDMAEYEREYKPYLLPFDALISANLVGGDVDHGRALITVK
ncbi:MAG TPA: DUF3352 domain-containing protein [Candidatus Limnocylindrales bacterium]